MQILSAEHLYKSGSAESNGDVIISLPRSTVAATSGQVLENHKKPQKLANGMRR